MARMQNLASSKGVRGLSMIDRPLILTTLVILLAGCASEPVSRLGQDVASRHPIAMQDDYQVMSLPVAAQLDGESRMKIAGFASAWRQDRSQKIEVRMPIKTPQDKLVRAQFERVRQQLLSEGVRGSVRLIREPAILGETLNISLRFMRSKANVVTPCGVWPDDLASASSLSGWDNEPYANFGCAYQTMMAVQTADPRDLTSMRAASPADGEMRARALAAIRRGQDPSVTWGMQAPSIGGADQ